MRAVDSVSMWKNLAAGVVLLTIGPALGMLVGLAGGVFVGLCILAVPVLALATLIPRRAPRRDSTPR